MIIAKLIHHPDGYFNVDGEVIPEDVFMDAFPSYPALPDGVTHRICVSSPANIHSQNGQVACDELPQADLDAIVAAKDALVAERNTRYPGLFNTDESGRSFSFSGSWPPVPNPREIFDPAKRRAEVRPDSAAGASPAIDGAIEEPAPPFVRNVSVVVAEVQAEADRRVDALTGEADPIRAIRKLLGQVAMGAQINKKRARGNAPAEDEAASDALETMLTQTQAIRVAEASIIAEVQALDDAAAGVFDVVNHPSWP